MVSLTTEQVTPPTTDEGEYNWFADFVSEKDSHDWNNKSWTLPTHKKIKERVELWHLGNVDAISTYNRQYSGRIEYCLDESEIRNTDSNMIEDGEEFEHVKILSSDQFLDQIKGRINAETSKAQKEMKEEWG